MDLSTLDLNSLPVWLVAIAIILYLLPRILERLAPFVPPLGNLLEAHRKRVEAAEERQDTALHWKLESNGIRLGADVAERERLLDVLEQALERSWDDRVATQADYRELATEIKELRFQVARMGDTLGLHGQNVAKFSDEIESLKERIGQLPERVDSLGAILLDEKR